LRRQTQRLQMKLTRPSCCVVEVLVLLIFDLLVCLFQNLLLGTRERFAHGADEFPVHMILCLC